MSDGDRLVLDIDGLASLQNFLNSKIKEGVLLCNLITESGYGPQTTLAVKLLQERINRLGMKDSEGKTIRVRIDWVLDLASLQAFVNAQNTGLLKPLPKPVPVREIQGKAAVKTVAYRAKLVLSHPPVLGHAPAYNFGAKREEYVTGKGEVVEGHSHRGVDISCKAGTSVYSATSGEVVKVERDPGGRGGNYVVVSDTSGFYHHYMHLGNEMKVRAGQQVSAGTLIGAVSRTGFARNSKAPTHLHYEIRKGINSGDAVNPTIALREAYRQHAKTAELQAH